MRELFDVGPASLERFLTGWYGEPDRAPAALPEGGAPPPLRRWFELTVRDAALEPLRALPMPAWRWPGPGHRLYAGEGLLAFAGPTAGPDEGVAPDHEVLIAAREPGRLRYLTAIRDVTWDVFPDPAP